MAWSKSNRITVMLIIDTAFFLLELGVGMVVGSLALMADAFHMLNDIISLLVGLWAVKAAQKPRSDRFSFGWRRAEILGAFFNAVFLIALCLSIILEAITRLLDPPKISNSKLILIVGVLGLSSNLAGFFVLGGHSHEKAEHDDPADHIRTVEEGHGSDALPPATGRAGSTSPPHADPRLQIQNGPAIRRDMKYDLDRRRSSNFGSILDRGLHPVKFRQGIISASQPTTLGDGTTNVVDAYQDDNISEQPSEASQLLRATSGSSSPNHPISNGQTRGTGGFRPSSSHTGHGHNKMTEKAKRGTDMGTSAMILHVIGDALGNVGVIVSALVIWLTPWSGRFYADPMVSLFIAVIILKTTIPLTSASAKILLQGTPDHLDTNEIRRDIQKIPGVVNCHHIHLWQLSETQPIASLHVQLDLSIDEDGIVEKYMAVVKAIRKSLHEYGIHNATVQSEFCMNGEHDHAGQAHLSASPDGAQALRGVDALEEDACLIGCVENCEESIC